MSVDSYHADKGTFTHSSLEYAGEWTWDGLFIPTPHKLRAYLDGELHHSDTKSTDVGTAVHALSEGKAIEDVLLIGPEARRNSKEWKEWAATVKEGDTRQQFKPSEVATVVTMHRNLLSHDFVREWMATPGKHEEIIRATCPVTDLPLKCKPDFRQVGVRQLSWKTAKEPEPHAFLPQAKRLGYIRQSALYRYITNLACGFEEREFVVVVGSESPHVVAVYEFPGVSMQEAQRQNMKVLESVARWRDWGWEPDWQNEIISEVI